MQREIRRGWHLTFEHRLGGLAGFLVRPIPFGEVQHAAANFDVALTETHPLETEAGLSMTWHGVSLFARSGLSFDVLERRQRSGGGWSMRIPLLAGVRQVAERRPTRSLAGYTASTGVNVIFWAAEDAGLDFEVLAGANVWVVSQGEPTPALSPDLRVSAGLAF